jgi:hypothetical protein
MTKYAFEPGGAWKSISGKKWERPLKLNMAGSAVRLFNDTSSEDHPEIVDTIHHDYDLDGRVLGEDGNPKVTHLDNIMGGWVDFPHRKVMTSITEVVDEGPVGENGPSLEKHWSSPIPDVPPTPPKWIPKDVRSDSHRRFDFLVDSTVNIIRDLAERKGGEYAGDLDRLANFRRNGAILDLPMEVIWAVYYAKHHDAIMQYIKDKQKGVVRERGEPISGRVDDLIVYLILFKLMLQEKNGIGA